MAKNEEGTTERLEERLLFAVLPEAQKRLFRDQAVCIADRCLNTFGSSQGRNKYAKWAQGHVPRLVQKAHQLSEDHPSACACPYNLDAPPSSHQDLSPVLEVSA